MTPADAAADTSLFDRDMAELHLEPNLNVRVRLRVYQERLSLLAVDARARFGRESPIGGKFIDINPGERGPLLLAAESTLPIEAVSEIDDVMASVKVAVEKLTTAISKVDPILDDTEKLTGEASAVSADVRTSLAAMMKNMEAISVQLRRVGDTATVLTANAALKSVDKELPALLGKAQQNASDVKQITQDARKLSGAAVVQVPPALRAGRAAADDAALMVDGVKRTWPFPRWSHRAWRQVRICPWMDLKVGNHGKYKLSAAITGFCRYQNQSMCLASCDSDVGGDAGRLCGDHAGWTSGRSGHTARAGRGAFRTTA